MPGAWGGGCVGGHSPQRHQAPRRLSWASPWGPEMCGEREWGSVVGQLLCRRRLAAAQVPLEVVLEEGTQETQSCFLGLA